MDLYRPVTYPKMAEKLPEGELGLARIKHFTLDAKAAAFTSMRAAITGGREAPIREGSYAQLFVGNTLMMSDTQMERRSNAHFVRAAKGHVLIAGLGLGMIVHAILENPEVLSVTVVEKYADVIKLVGPTLTDPRVKCVEGDVLTWRPEKGTKFDVIYHDVWPDICADNLKEIQFLHRAFRRFLAPGGWQNSWMRETLMAQRRQSKRRGFGW